MSGILLKCLRQFIYLPYITFQYECLLLISLNVISLNPLSLITSTKAVSTLSKLAFYKIPNVGSHQLGISSFQMSFFPPNAPYEPEVNEIRTL